MEYLLKKYFFTIYNGDILKKTKIGVFGSCISRDAFNSFFNHNYKDFFLVKISSQRTSMISILQEVINVDKNLIEINPPNQQNNVRSYFIAYDLNRRFIQDLKEKDIDYLIIDNYLEIRMGILYFNNNIITNNDWDLPNTQFYKNLDNKFVFSIIDYPEEYFNIWTKYCDLFFEFLNTYCPNVKVILNKGRVIDKVMREDGSVYINDEFKKRAEIINPILDKLDRYIYTNFDVEVINFDFENIFLDENHKWGIGPVHYSMNYYPSLLNNINSIIQRNKSENLNSKKTSDYNKENFINKSKQLNLETKLFLNNFVLNNFKNEILKFNNTIDSIKNELNLIESNYDANLVKYITGRIDLKNFGSEYNSIQIIKNTDSTSKVEYPRWFKSDNGEGIIIQSKKMHLDLMIKCVNDGLLKIWLRGPDVKDRNGKRFPIYIDYINLIINDQSILKNRKLVCLEKPFVFEKKVKNSEILSIHIDWEPFNNLSIYE